MGESPNRRRAEIKSERKGAKDFSASAHHREGVFARLYGKDSTGFDFWQELSLEDCATLAKENAENYERVLKRFGDEGLGQVAIYKTSEGVAYQNTFRELLTHVLFHSSTHRGNIVLKMREENYAPPVIDYIIYLRETAKK